MYQKKGYPRTQVKYVLNIDENAGRGTATFQITESPKVKILEVDFVGAKAFTREEAPQDHQDPQALDVFLDHRQRGLQGRPVRGGQGEADRALSGQRLH